MPSNRRGRAARHLPSWALLSLVLAWPAAACAQRGDPVEALRAQRNAVEKQLEAVAIIDRSVMVPMRDGKRMLADVYRPKNASGPVPIVFVRTPYNFNWWDVKNGAPRDMSRELEAVRRGYAYIEMDERGHFYSEGNYDILGPPRTDGEDAIKWMASQPWANGKVGLTGCSSTAEWQLGVVTENNPGLATFNVQGFGAGVGQVGPYYEQGNWYRGGAVQMLFITWLYGEQNQIRPMLAPGTPQADITLARKMFDLAPQMPPVDWSAQLWHLPEDSIISSMGGPPGIFDTSMPVPTGGNMIARAPNDPAWYKGGLWHANTMPIAKPGLWFMSWYDVSVSPNLAAYNYVRQHAPGDIGNEQYAIIAPVLHCAYTRATKNTMIGDLDVGDARLPYDSIMYAWFDHFMKGDENGILQSRPKVQYYVIGLNQWKSSPTWPPAGATPRTFYLHSAGSANTMYGDGSLSDAPQTKAATDKFTYDPMNPVPTFGGGGCCEGNAVHFGSFDQRTVEARNDVLVYTTDPFKEGVEMSGPITVTLYVSSNRKDTDFTWRIDDVYPDGRAFNLIENIQRMRYRDGYDKPEVWMQPGKVYKVTFQPIDFSNYFKPGHRLRLEISSSNFPRFDRNLNTGGNNYDESSGLVAKNAVHHDKMYPSAVTITVVPSGGK